MSEARYQELSEAQEEAYIARVKASLEDVKAGRVAHFDNVDDLLATPDEDEK